MHQNPYHDTKDISDIRVVTPLYLERRAHEAIEWESLFGADTYAVSQDFKVCFCTDHAIEHADEKCIVVPAGFLTDMASVPRICRPFMSRIGRHTEAAVVHDYLYTIHYYLADSQHPFYIHKKKELDKAYRAFADHVFLEIMKAMSVKKGKSLLAFWMVRLFGKWSWKKKRPYDFRVN